MVDGDVTENILELHRVSLCSSGCLELTGRSSCLLPGSKGMCSHHLALPAISEKALNVLLPLKVFLRLFVICFCMCMCMHLSAKPPHSPLLPFFILYLCKASFSALKIIKPSYWLVRSTLRNAEDGSCPAISSLHSILNSFVKINKHLHLLGMKIHLGLTCIPKNYIKISLLFINNNFLAYIHIPLRLHKKCLGDKGL